MPERRRIAWLAMGILSMATPVRAEGGESLVGGMEGMVWFLAGVFAVFLVGVVAGIWLSRVGVGLWEPSLRVSLRSVGIAVTMLAIAAGLILSGDSSGMIGFLALFFAAAAVGMAIIDSLGRLIVESVRTPRRIRTRALILSLGMYLLLGLAFLGAILVNYNNDGMRNNIKLFLIYSILVLLIDLSVRFSVLVVAQQREYGKAAALTGSEQELV